MFLESGCCAEGETTMNTGTLESQSKEQLTSPTTGLRPREPGSSGVWGDGGRGMLKVGLYLQGLEEAQGIRTAAWDEAEGGIGQRCPGVGPKNAQEA